MSAEDERHRQSVNPEESKSFLARLNDPIVLFNAILAVATISLGLIAFLQWKILQRTDLTLQAGERAFVYMKDIDVQQLKPSSQGWQITPSIINNGTTAATSLSTAVLCLLADAQGPIEQKFPSPNAPPSLIGAKQFIDLGYCRVTLDEIKRSQNYVRVFGTIFYKDVFRNSHQTRFCRNVAFQIETNGTTHSMIRCIDSPDCADWDCVAQDRR